jgi:adenylate kinase
MNLIVLGPPGAGKGTVGKLIADHFGIPIISTGDLLRKEAADRTSIGIKAKGYMDQGEYVPDEIVMQIIRDRLKKEDCRKGFILDGYPRTIEQVKALENAKIRIDTVVNFNASREVIIDRLSTRLTCSTCGAIYNIKNVPPKKAGICDKCGAQLYQREDQKPEVVKERLKVYGQQTSQLVDHYRKKGILRDVDANPSQPQKIFESAMKVLRH